MSLSPERLAQIKAATADISVKPSDAGSSTGTIGEFLRSRSESAGQDSSVFNIGGELLTNLKSRVNKASEAAYGGDTSVPERILRVAGQTAGAVDDVVGAGLKTAYHVAVPEAGKKEVRRWGREILDTDIGQAGMEALHAGVDAWDKWSKENPNASEDIKSVVNIGALLPVTKIAKGALGAVTSAGEGIASTLKTGAKIAEDVASAGKSTVKGFARGVGKKAAATAEEDLAEAAARTAANTTEGSVASAADDALRTPGATIPKYVPSGITPILPPPIMPKAPIDIPDVPSAPPITPKIPTDVSIPPAEQIGERAGRFLKQKGQAIEKKIRGASENIDPNIAGKELENAAYNALPQEGQAAIRGGVLRRDVEAVARASAGEKSKFKQMIQAAEDFSNYRGDTDPANIVGEHIQSRISALNNLRKATGDQLGKLVEGLDQKALGGIDKIQDAVLSRLNEVPDLKGITLKVGEDGKRVLDFSRTALNSTEDEGARKILNNFFSDLNGKDAFELHRLRQSLFANLGGRKAARLVLNSAETKGQEAIREGIADILEEVSPAYKGLNNEYRTIMGPFKDLTGYFKNLEDAPADVLNREAARLARGLTNNTKQGTKIMAALQKMEEILGKSGDISDVSTQRLQDFLNAVNRYYDISHDSAFEGLIKSGINSSDVSPTVGGMLKKGLDAVAEDTYVTKHTQRAGLKKLVDSIPE